jgi:hypothetical protein
MKGQVMVNRASRKLGGVRAPAAVQAGFERPIRYEPERLPGVLHERNFFWLIC